MSQIINLPWLSRNLEVTDSTDPTLVGISGMVVDETRRTILVNTGGNEVTLALASISKQDSSKYKLDWFNEDCGYYGQNFRLPPWEVHEFKNTENAIKNLI